MLLFVVVLCFAVLVIAFSIWNTVTMRSASEENAREYVSEITSQIASTVNTEQADKKATLSGIGEAMSLLLEDGIPQTETDAYLKTALKSHNESGQFAYVLFLRDGKKPIRVGDADAAASVDADHPVVQEATLKDECVAYIDGDYVLYACPVYDSGASVGTLVGAVSCDYMRNLVDVQTYRDESNFCIANRNGHLLMTSSDGQSGQLESVLDGDAPGDTAVTLKEHLVRGHAGVMPVTFSDGAKNLLAYAPVEGEDWALLTLFPIDMLSGIYEAYMTRALLITAGAAVVFIVLVVLLRLMWSQSRRQLEHSAFVDDITGGNNDTDFRLRYDALRRAEDIAQYSVVMLDIKDFKLVNEGFGFTAGDELLKQVYSGIERQLEDTEFAARAEMDHYFICLRENTQAGIDQRIDGITRRVNAECFLRDRAFNIEFGQGACLVADAGAGADVTVLWENARIAKDSAAPSAKGGCTLFTQEMAENISRNRKLDLAAEHGMADRQFVVYYQPKVSMSTGKAKGAEALVRWVHPERGLISPAQFIPALEETGRIQDLDRYVLAEVCRWVEERMAAGKAVVPVSVNLSRAHFWEESFVDEFVDMIEQHGIDKANIEFEITETLFMEEAWRTRIKDGIRHMHSHGLRCAVDDFGVGYSSLSLVNEMDVDTLKFDRSFFTDLAAEKSQIMAHCLLDMASDLSMDVVIEGIEDEDQIAFLRQEKCDVIQGYYYSKPLPEDEFDAWLDGNR